MAVITAAHWWQHTHVGASANRERARILAGEIVPSIKRRIDEVYERPEVQREVSRFASNTENIAQDVIGEVAQVYTIPPRRMLVGGTPEQEAAFRELVIESSIDTAAPAWSRAALFAGPVTVIPVIEVDDLAGSRLRLHSFDAWRCEHLRNPEALWSFPEEIAVKEYDAEPETRGPIRVMVGTDEVWMHFAGDGGKPVMVRPHGLGLVPAAIFRASDPVIDPWSVDLGRRCRDGAVEAGLEWAKLGWTRKTQSRKLMTLAFDDSASAPRQTLDPELPMELPAQAQAGVLDLVVDPAHHLATIDKIKSSIFHAYGVGASDYKLMSDRAIAISIARKQALRSEQVRWMIPAEARLWKVALGVVDAAVGHRFEGLFPNWRDLEIKIEFPELQLVDDPTARENLYVQRVARGATSPVAEYRVDHPEMSEEEARAAVMANLEVSADVAEYRSKRNAAIVAEPDRGFQSMEQETGRLGGRRSGESRAADDEDLNDE